MARDPVEILAHELFANIQNELVAKRTEELVATMTDELVAEHQVQHLESLLPLIRWWAAADRDLCNKKHMGSRLPFWTMDQNITRGQRNYISGPKQNARCKQDAKPRQTKKQQKQMAESFELSKQMVMAERESRRRRLVHEELHVARQGMRQMLVVNDSQNSGYTIVQEIRPVQELINQQVNTQPRNNRRRLVAEALNVPLQDPSTDVPNPRQRLLSRPAEESTDPTATTDDELSRHLVNLRMD